MNGVRDALLEGLRDHPKGAELEGEPAQSPLPGGPGAGRPLADAHGERAPEHARKLEEVLAAEASLELLLEAVRARRGALESTTPGALTEASGRAHPGAESGRGGEESAAAPPTPLEASGAGEEPLLGSEPLLGREPLPEAESEPESAPAPRGLPLAPAAAVGEHLAPQEAPESEAAPEADGSGELPPPSEAFPSSEKPVASTAAHSLQEGVEGELGERDEPEGAEAREQEIFESFMRLPTDCLSTLVLPLEVVPGSGSYYLLPVDVPEEFLAYFRVRQEALLSLDYGGMVPWAPDFKFPKTVSAFDVPGGGRSVGEKLELTPEQFHEILAHFLDGVVVRERHRPQLVRSPLLRQFRGVPLPESESPESAPASTSSSTPATPPRLQEACPKSGEAATAPEESDPELLPSTVREPGPGEYVVFRPRSAPKSQEG